ncbi:hypothetical protein PR202_gb22197 [Eleusine coracana subsp. coracana]|uniref:Uncharacterized protein n=1 Tax=Eleusine coracana subsp. coracana TaxID=191504 RepID=A0AAV5FFW5_ELECO|nr:hypothetical protein QOZ80_6AG0540070 [Eleusine coracana subsp. coracana]GJN33578.1 hypothetical protein PR202_gb22197 [Eleusine coracana subsp. coracana]
MAMDAAPMLKRKGAEAPEPWVDGVPVPATKIRRLDAVVPSVEPGAVVMQPVEPAGAGVPLPPPPQPFEVEEVPMSGEVAPPVVVAPAANDERAIVVYQPAEAARNLLRGPLRPEAPLRVSPDWIRGIKSTVLQEASNHRALFEELASRDENANLAMVPWAPAHVAQAAATTTSSAPGTEMMDADQDAEGAASMEVEQDGAGQPVPPIGFAMQGDAFHHQQQQWPPQHCMAPQQLQVPATSYQPSPVTWSW